MSRVTPGRWNGRGAVRCTSICSSPTRTLQGVRAVEWSIAATASSGGRRCCSSSSNPRKPLWRTPLAGPLLMSGSGGLVWLTAKRARVPARCLSSASASQVPRKTSDDPVFGIYGPSLHLPDGVNLCDCSLRLYQYDSCPFCRKARAVLDFVKVPYEVTEVHPLSKKEMKDLKIESKKKKVPVLMVTLPTNEVIVIEDSKRIISSLLKLKSDGRVNPIAGTPDCAPYRKIEDLSEAEQKRIAERLEWGERFVQIVVTNIYRNISEARETFTYLLTHPSFSMAEKWLGNISGTAVMYLVAKRRMKQLQITDEREALCNEMKNFIDSLNGKAFHGGDSPDAADFNTFGIVRSFADFTTGKEVFNRTNVAPWYSRMSKAIGPSGAIASEVGNKTSLNNTGTQRATSPS